jgi:hypothetical protein
MNYTIRANYPINEILDFRESGYTDKLLEELQKSVGPEWDIYLYFELSRWKGVDLKIEPNARKKMVLCVGDESTRTNYSFLDEVDIIFRMYLPEDKRGTIYHVPVGPSRHFAPDKLVPFAERPRNVFFSGNLHQGRAGLYRALTGLPPLPFAVLHRLRRIVGEQFDKVFPASTIRFSTGFHNGIVPHEYARFVGESKIILCPAGIESPESMRHFEAASLGCVVVTEQMPDVTVYRNAPFITLSSWRELKPTIASLLREPARLLDLHHKTLDWWHTTAQPPAVGKLMQERMQLEVQKAKQPSI